MILRGGHGANGDAIGKGEQAALRADQHLLNNHGGTRGAKRAGEALVHRVLGLRKLGGDDNALSGSQTVGLNYQRRALLANIGERILLVIKAAVSGGGDAGAVHELLGEALGALKLGASGTRAKAGHAQCAHGIGDARDQRGLGANNHQANTRALYKISDNLGVRLVYGNVFAHVERTAVARSNIELAAAGRLGELLCQGVLATAAAQQQDVDNLGLCVHGSSLELKGDSTFIAPRGRTC